MADDEVLQRVNIALAQSKLVRREAAKNVVLLARLRDHLQPDDPAQGDSAEHEYTAQDQEDDR